MSGAVSAIEQPSNRPRGVGDGKWKVGVRLVLFDIDGTLIFTRGVGVQAFARTMASEFGRVDLTGRIRFGGRTDPSLVRELFGQAGVEYTPDTVQRFFDAYVFWLDHLLRESHSGGLCPGILDFLKMLGKQSQPPVIGLLTGNIRLGAEIKLRRFGLWGEFETGAFGDDHEDRNEIARVARRRAGDRVGRELDGEEILVIGDTPHDIACGRAIGARVLAVATGACTAEVLRGHRPDWVLESFDGARADEFCR